MAQALYQRYRPQQFSNLVGQDHIRETLLNEILQDDVAHAYMLSGPRGIGKTSTARLIARAVNCISKNSNGEPCGTCVPCITILDQKALDIMEIDAASHTGVDHVREHIIEYARTAPSSLKKKVFIIDEVHMLSTSAFNALLKTLEEPPAHAIFILATTELHKVPATIISRCEHFRFVRLSPEHIAQQLQSICTQEKRTVDEAVLRHIARLADGAMRDAQSILGQVLAIQAPVITLDMVSAMLSIGEAHVARVIAQRIADQQLVEALDAIKEAIASGAQASQILTALVGILRAALLARACDEVSYLEYEIGDVVEARRFFTSIQPFSPENITEWIERVLRACEQQKISTIPELPLELAVTHCIPKKVEVKTSQDHVGPIVKSKQNTTTVIENTSMQSSSTMTPSEHAAKSVASTESEHIVEQSSVASVIQPISAKEINDALVTPAAGHTRDSVEKLWPKVLEATKKRNHGLHLTLQVGKFVDVVGKTIQLGFQYQFYQDRLNEARNRKIIEEALTEILGQGMHIEAIIGKQFELKETTDAVGNVEVVSAKELENVWDLAVHAFQPKHIEDVS